MKKPVETTVYIFGVIAVVAVGTTTYLAFQLRESRETASTLKAEFATYRAQSEQNLKLASSTVNNLESELNELKDDLEDLADDYRDERNRNEDFEDQIRDLAGTLGDLDKLAKTDEELLQKYSKVYFLNENYIPERLEKIDDRYILEGRSDQYFHARAIDYFEDMLNDARRDDIDLKVVSAYRSFDEQGLVKNNHTTVFGSGANTFSADQGYSEHQLGTTVDLTIEEVGGAYTSFAETEEYEWLLDNAHKYGFILSYPEGNEFYIFEPWHWRFVGVDLAKDLERSGDSFYDLEQREIDEYLLTIFD